MKKLRASGLPTRGVRPAGRSIADLSRTALRGIPLPSAPRHSAARCEAAAQGAELVRELETPLVVAVATASMQAERLRELALHFDRSADLRLGALLADLGERGERLHDSLQQAERVLRQQRSRSRLEPARTAVSETRPPFEVVLRRALRQPLARFGSQGIACALDVEPDLSSPGSQGVWSQVLAGLVTNSALHGFPDRHEGEIHITARRRGAGLLRLTYRDNGIGLSPAARENAFRRRFSSRSAQGSSGLGLCLLRDIVHTELNGAIELLETPVGAAFAIDVPTLPGP